ncbi:hypothetical protein [Agrobacterium larrymoorei]|uniref:DUF2059 domain-containing protein n=1 Tax=Agrobacterium larrymoorei TaxID=160699 RepID=A0AAF0KFW4_9HYPH|nr:hypothetical protein [Agrobacterium larrymoorei]WHA43723.1 hypothetical protein CFBP5477_021130 [Agrobacterium larrymoorei]
MQIYRKRNRALSIEAMWPIGVTVAILAFLEPTQAQSSCLLEVENVKLIADNVPTLLDYAEQDFSKETGKDISAADKILRPVVTDVFGNNALSQKLIEKLDSHDCDSPALLAIGKLLKESNAKLANQRTQTSSPAKVTSEKRVKELEALADSFALPELFAENSVAGAAMNAALEIYFTEKPEELAHLDGNEAKRLAEDILPELRQREGNPIRFDRDVSRGIAKAQLTWVLSTLSEDDIKQLKDFYASPAVMAERDRLIASYKEQIDRDSVTMLVKALEAFKPHFSGEASLNDRNKK